jgi:hypothetical protein
MSKPFTQYKVLYAAIHGYHPFNPDAGIFAGGYQGSLYPNPTTLHSPNTGFNPYLYQVPFPTPYTMKNTGDFYEGLGIGNPGINFRNAGHILGILDTYNRISYGLKIIKGIRSLSTADKFGTSITINIPMLDGQTLVVIKTLSGSDIYPSFSEEPDDYIVNFVDDTGLILNPRTSEPFNFDGDKYAPDVSIIDFNTLFTGLHIFSYRNMAEKFQDYFSQLITFAQTFPRIDQQKETAFGSVPYLTPIIDIPKHYPFEDRLDFLNSADVEFNFSNFGTPAHRFGSNFKVLNRTDALKLMTENDIFHKNSENIYEYRSLTELNSVINIVPVQGYSFTFNCLTTDPSLLYVPPFTGAVQARFFVVFSIVDVIINILNLSDKSVSIDGSVLIEYLGNPSPFFQIQPDTLEKIILTPNPQIQRKVSISTSLTNLFTWDRVWLGLEEFNDKTLEVFSANHNITNFLQPVDSVNFSENFDLQQGNNCIRMRILSHSMGFVNDTFDYDKITTNLTINIPNIDPIDYSFEAKAGQSFIV